MTLGSRVEVTIPTLRNSSSHSSGNMSPVSALSSFACAIVFDWSWSPIHKLTGLDVGETRWDNATWCNTTPNSYTDGQRRANYYWEFIHINSEHFFVEQLLRNTNHRGYGSGTPPRKLGDWKGGSDESQIKNCGSDGKAGDTFACRMYIACRGSRTKCHRTKCHGHNVVDKILWGQNVIGQNVKTFCPRHFFDNIFSTAFCPMTFCQYNILSAIFCPVTFSPATLVGIQPSCNRPDKLGYVQSQYRKFKQWSLVRTVSV